MSLQTIPRSGSAEVTRVANGWLVSPFGRRYDPRRDEIRGPEEMWVFQEWVEVAEFLLVTDPSARESDDQDNP